MKKTIPHLVFFYKKNLKIPLTSDLKLHPTTVVNNNAFLDLLYQWVLEVDYMDIGKTQKLFENIQIWKNIIEKNMRAVYWKPLAYNKIYTVYNLIKTKRERWHFPWNKLKRKYKFFGEDLDYRALTNRIFSILFNRINDLRETKNSVICKWILQDEEILNLELNADQKEKINLNFVKIITEIKSLLPEPGSSFYLEEHRTKYKIWMEFLNKAIDTINKRLFKEKDKKYEDNINTAYEETEAQYMLQRVGYLEHLEYPNPVFIILEHIDKFLNDLVAQYIAKTAKEKKRVEVQSQVGMVFKYPKENQTNYFIINAKEEDIILTLKKEEPEERIFYKDKLVNQFDKILVPLSSTNELLKPYWIFNIVVSDKYA